MNVVEEIAQAEARIRPHIRTTYLDYSPYYSELGGANVYFKLENLQHTGSFKVRGAMSKVLSLTEAERRRGVVTASSGNHGAAVAYSLGKLGASGIVFVPETVAPTKAEAIQQLGAELRYFGDDGGLTEVHARAYAEDHGLTYISPYNDPQVIGGQGTIGIELKEQLPAVDAVFVAVGGGGLISGIGAYLKSVHPEVQIIGCSPKNSQVMIESIKTGKLLDLPSLPTLSDGTAGGVEADAITFVLCQTYVDEFLTVTEDEIRASLRQFMAVHHMMIEGAAAVAAAAYLKMQDKFKGKNVVVVVCGANVSLEVLKEVL